MTDKFSSSVRSLIMSKVRQKHTKPEIQVRSILHRAGFRFSLHRKDLPGNPDIILPKYKTVIFVHGCFWHQHKNCPKSARPTTKVEFWNNKLDKNIARDAVNIELLKKASWKVITVWECELKKNNIENLTERLASNLRL